MSVDTATVMERVRRVLASDTWFSSVGMPLSAAEREEASLYLGGLGLTEVSPAAVSDWRQAKAIASDPQWSRAWWNAEMAAQKALYAQAAKSGEIGLLQDLTTLMEESADMFHGAAAAAASRDGVADPSTVRSAAGAASQSAYHHALAHFAGKGEGHFLAAKFRLFLAGRWPLCVVGDRFYIF